MNVPNLTPEQVEANKALGIHPKYWETAIEIPESFTAEWLDAVFPTWRAVGQEIIDKVVQSQDHDEEKPNV